LRNTETEDKPRQRAAISKATATAKQAQKGHQKSLFPSMLHSNGVHPFHLSTPDRQSRDVLNLDLMVTFLPAPVESDAQSRTGPPIAGHKTGYALHLQGDDSVGQPIQKQYSISYHPALHFYAKLIYIECRASTASSVIVQAEVADKIAAITISRAACHAKTA